MTRYWLLILVEELASGKGTAYVDSGCVESCAGENYCSITSTSKPYDPWKLKESVTGTRSAVDMIVMLAISQRHYEDLLQDFASSGHAGVSKTGPGERTSFYSQVHRIHTGEHLYVYVATAHDAN